MIIWLVKDRPDDYKDYTPLCLQKIVMILRKIVNILRFNQGISHLIAQPRSGYILPSPVLRASFVAGIIILNASSNHPLRWV